MKQLLVLSGKGGTGKTTVASALIKLWQVKAFADVDVDAANLHFLNAPDQLPFCESFYGMDKATIDIDKCIKCGLCYDSCRFHAIVKTDDHYQVNGLKCESCAVCHYVCPEGAIKMQKQQAGQTLTYQATPYFATANLQVGSGNSGLLVTRVKANLKSAQTFAPLAVIDGSPGIGCPVTASMVGVDLILIVTEPTISGYTDMVRIYQTAKQLQHRAVVCINKCDIDAQLSAQIEAFCTKENLTVAGQIPYDSQVVKALNQGRSILDQHSPVTTALQAMAVQLYNLLNE